jgi:hypothetical protein
MRTPARGSTSVARGFHRFENGDHTIELPRRPFV